MVGLLPLCAVTVFEGEVLTKYPEMTRRLRLFLEARPEVRAFIHDPAKRGQGGRRLASLLDEAKLRRVLAKMLDEQEFLSPYGIRALSRYHAEHPFVFHVGHQEYQVSYLPAESDSGMFGGNSNWRGPIWMPVNGLIIRALLQYYTYYGNVFTIDCPTGSGRSRTSGRRRSRPSWPRGSRTARSCRWPTSAGGWTSSSSTGGWWRAWSRRALSTRRRARGPSSWPPSTPPLGPASATNASATRARSPCSI
jgi:hypothetical protein